MRLLTLADFEGIGTTLIAEFRGHKFYEHPLLGDDAGIVLVKPNGTITETAYEDRESIEEAFRDGEWGLRFTCPNNPDHAKFYLRRMESEGYTVTADGRIAHEPTRNSYDCEGDGPVMCEECAGSVQADDAWPDQVLDEDELL